MIPANCSASPRLSTRFSPTRSPLHQVPVCLTTHSALAVRLPYPSGGVSRGTADRGERRKMSGPPGREGIDAIGNSILSASAGRIHVDTGLMSQLPDTWEVIQSAPARHPINRR